MRCYLDIDHPEVRGKLKHWGESILDSIGVDGLQLDAIKHIRSDFFSAWAQHMEGHAQRDLFFVTGPAATTTCAASLTAR